MPKISMDHIFQWPPTEGFELRWSFMRCRYLTHKAIRAQGTAFHVRRSQILLCTFQANLHWMKICHFVMKASGTLLWQLFQVQLFPRAFSCLKSIKHQNSEWNLVKVNNKDTRMTTLTSLCVFIVNFEQEFSGCRDVLVFSLLPLNK